MFVLHGGGERKGKKHEINVLKLTREGSLTFFKEKKKKLLF